MTVPSHPDYLLGRVQGTSHFHHATLVAEMELLPTGERFTVTSYITTPVSSNGSVVELSGMRLRVQAPGTAIINASFGSHAQDELRVYVEDTVLDPITSVSLSAPLAGSDTLQLGVGETRAVSVRVDFETGASFSDATQLDWIPASELLVFASSEPGVISVSESGTLMLLDNHYERIELNTTLACGVACGTAFGTAVGTAFGTVPTASILSRTTSSAAR